MATAVKNRGDHATKNDNISSDEGFKDLAKPEPSDTVQLSDTAKQLLQLYDEYQELRLERALLEAQVARDTGGGVLLSYRMSCTNILLRNGCRPP